MGKGSAIAVTFLGLGAWVAPSLVMRAVASGKNLPEQIAQDWPSLWRPAIAGSLLKSFADQPRKREETQDRVDLRYRRKGKSGDNPGDCGTRSLHIHALPQGCCS